MDTSQWIKSLLRMFYIVPTSEYKMENEIHIFKEAWPFFTLFIVLENVILFLQRKSTARFNDGVTSISHGIFYESARIMSRGMESCMYFHIHGRYKLVDFFWDNLLTWYMVAVIVDFFYYWVHRASHEIHILWAQHQVHHSSEDYNLFVGLRHPFLHNWCGFLFYLPMAFFVPPVQYLVHQQFSLLYQFWTHTSTIDHLGPLELIFNTPRHHRAHHGSNKKFLDKNYGGFLIIWDRIFGTFIDYEPSEQITYGLVVQPQTFNPLYLQFFYTKYVYDKFKRLPGWSNKLQSVIKGPSWLPGRPWTGCDAEKINVHERDKYDPPLHPCNKIYLGLHFGLCLFYFYRITTLSEILFIEKYYGQLFYICFSLTIIGMFFDGCPGVVTLEATRCCVSYCFSNYIDTSSTCTFYLKLVYALSAAWWIYKSLREFVLLNYFSKISVS